MILPCEIQLQEMKSSTIMDWILYTKSPDGKWFLTGGNNKSKTHNNEESRCDGRSGCINTVPDAEDEISERSSDVSAVLRSRGYDGIDGRPSKRWSEKANGTTNTWVNEEEVKKGKDFAKDEIYGSYETCLTARSHSSDVKRTLVSQDWISRKPSILTSGFYQTRHLRASYGYLFFKMASSLDAFSSYPLPRGYSACLVRQLIN